MSFSAESHGRSKPMLPACGATLRQKTKPRAWSSYAKRMDTRPSRSASAPPAVTTSTSWPGRTEALVPIVRKAIGDDAVLLVDANSCYTPDRAIEVGRMLEQSDVGHFEEPCPYWELEWTAEVAAALDVPVAGGEQDNDLAQWRRMIAMNAVDIVQPDVCYLGGMTRSLRVAKMAEKAGKLCVPHSANRSMVTVFSLHLLGAIPNAGPHLEFCIEPPGWTAQLLTEPLEAKNGHVQIPEGPGWGVEINPAWLEKTVRNASER